MSLWQNILFLYKNEVLCYRLTCCIYTCIYPNKKTVDSLKHLTPYLGGKLCTDGISLRDEFVPSKLGRVRFDCWSLDHSERDRDCVCLLIRVSCVERFWGPMPYFKKIEMFCKWCLEVPRVARRAVHVFPQVQILPFAQ
jgi:hypothetical protein